MDTITNIAFYNTGNTFTNSAGDDYYDIITRNGYKNVRIVTERDRTNPLISKVYDFCVNNNINVTMLMLIIVILMLMLMLM